VSNPEINIGQDGSSNTQNNTFNFAASKVNPPIPDNVPIASPNFVGRVKELEEIHAKLQGGQGVSVCAVEGMGGLGKSELALQYAKRYRQEYAARYWFLLRGVGLAQSVVTMASRYLDLPEVMQSQTVEAQAEWYWQNWIPTEGKVLVIFDDVTDLASIPKQARPLAERFQVLVTTRKRKLSSQFADIPLDVISEAEALELLRKLLGKSRVDREEIAAKAICEYLGYLPLGVELAGRYLQLDEDLSLRDYQQRLTIADESLDLQETEEINATRGVIAAFELSWQELSASTVKVAMLLGLFAPAYMVWGLVEEVTAQLIDEGDLHEGRKQLNNLYLIKAIDQERTRFALHPLVREFFRYKLVISDSITKQNIYYLVLGIIKYDVVLAKSLVVSELEKFNPFFDNSIKSIDYARLIRESRRSWYEGFGVLAQMIGITSPDGSLPKIGSYIYNSDEATESKNILYADYYGEEYDEYFELPEEIFILHSQKLFNILFEEKGFTSFTTSSGNKNFNIPLVSEYKKLSEKLSKIIGNDCSLPTNNSALIKESGWYAAYFLSGKYPLNYFPRAIPVIEIKRCLSIDSQWSSAVSSYERTCLQIVFESLTLNDVDEFVYPWNSRYSQDPQEILNFVTTVYQESLSAYQDIVERWFGNFTRYLQTLNMFPITIEGVVITSPDGRYSLDWYWIPLKEGNSNRVIFNLAKAPMTENEISILLNNARENRDQLASKSPITKEDTNILFSHYHYKSSNLFTPKFPVTHIVYGWLWNDLEKLNLVSGRFDPHIW
jgi:hypothetical protein